MDFLSGLGLTLMMCVFGNVWYITICLLLYAIWREIRLIRQG